MDESLIPNAPQDYLQWTETKVIEWIMKINDGEYCDNKYVKAFMENNINGKSLHKMKSHVDLITALKYAIAAPICIKIFQHIESLQKQRSTAQSIHNNGIRQQSVSSAPVYNSTSTNLNSTISHVTNDNNNNNNNDNNNNNNENNKNNKNNKLLIKDAMINLKPNLYIEFKQIKPVNGSCDVTEICEVMLKYLNAFVNTKGGTIYFGIDSNGIINGQEYINNETINNIQKYINNRLHEWTPKNEYLNLKQEINIQFIEVIHRRQNNYCYLIPNVYVIKASINGIKLTNDNKFKNHKNKSFRKTVTTIEEVKSISDKIMEIKQQLKEMTGKDVNKSTINDIWIAKNKNKQMTLQYLCALYLNDDSKEQKQEIKCDENEQSEIWVCSKCSSSNYSTFQFCVECGHAYAHNKNDIAQILLKTVRNINNNSYIPSEERRTGWIVKNISNKNINIKAKLIKISNESDVIVKYDKIIEIKMKPKGKMYIFVDVKAPLIPKEYNVLYQLVLWNDSNKIICDNLQLNVLVKTEFSEQQENKIKLILGMGFNDRKKIIIALKKWKWDETSAINWLATHHQQEKRIQFKQVQICVIPQ